MIYTKEYKNTDLVKSQQSELVGYRQLLVRRGLTLLNTLEKRITEDIRKEYDRYFILGLNHGKKNEYDEAIRSYSECVRLDEYYAGAYYNRGHMYRKKGLYKEAVSDFTKAIELEPNLSYAYLYRGLCYIEYGNYDSAGEAKHHTSMIESRSKIIEAALQGQIIDLDSTEIDKIKEGPFISLDALYGYSLREVQCLCLDIQVIEKNSQ